MAHIHERALKKTVNEFRLKTLEKNLLIQILLRNLSCLNDGNFELVLQSKPGSEEYADGMVQLNNQVELFDVHENERFEIPYIETVIFSYIFHAYLTRDMRRN